MASKWDFRAGRRICKATKRNALFRQGWDIGCAATPETIECPPCQDATAVEAAWSGLYVIMEELLIGAAITIGIGLVLRLIPASFTFDIIEFLFPKAFRLIRATGFDEGLATAVKNAGPASGIFAELIGASKTAVRNFVAETSPEFASLLTKVR